MASIYDKALKRKDFSGIVDQDALASKALAADDARVLRSSSNSNPASSATGGANVGGAGSGGGAGRGEGKKMSKEERKKAEDKRDESKAGADVGKIVNLMAGDANRVSDFFASCFGFGFGFGWCAWIVAQEVGEISSGVEYVFVLVCGRFGCSWYLAKKKKRFTVRWKEKCEYVRAPMCSFDSDDRSWESVRSECSNIGPLV